MSNTIDLIGKKVGRLTVIGEAFSKNGRRYWPCKCDCGKETNVETYRLTHELTLSCGCLQRELAQNQYKDLTGNQYGRLTVLNKAFSKNGRLYWHCKCDCGNEKDIRGDSLTSGKTTSCGCYQKEKITQIASQIEDLTGQKFNRLTVLRRDFSKTNKVFWRCKCDCGNETSVDTTSLKTGRTKSCGCYQKERTSETHLGMPSATRVDMRSQRFGKLLVLNDEPIYNSDKRILKWHCKCDCGTEIWVDGHSLRTGNTRSCGCVKSYGEELIGNILTDLNINFQKEKCFSDLKNPKTDKFLRFDFYLPNYNILIEFDGKHHFEDTYQTTTDEYQFKDNIKNIWAQEHNYKLIRIPYTEINNINQDYLLQLIGVKEG